MKIPILTNDPGFSHWGMARMLLDTDTLDLELQELILVDTEKSKQAKVVRVSSDVLSRSEVLQKAYHKACKGCMFSFAEVPHGGAKSAAAIRGFGIVIGILAGSPIPLVQVQPTERQAVTGLKHPTKAQMIEWGFDRYPHPTWKRANNKPTGALTAANEHLADALATGEAGVLTDEFRRSIALFRAAA